MRLIRWLNQSRARPAPLGMVAVVVASAALIVALVTFAARWSSERATPLNLGVPASAAGAQSAAGAAQDRPMRYVDAGKGSDSNRGTSDSPWKTIQKAADWAAGQGAAGNGAVVRVRTGDYPERVRVNGGGTAGAPVRFEATGRVTTKGFTVRADHVTIRGFEITNTANTWDDGVGIFVEGRYCILKDNYIHFATRGGILLFGTEGQEDGSTDCTVQSNRLYRNGLMGIEIHGRNHVISDNEIWGTIQYHPRWLPPPRWVDADGIRFFGSGHVIRDNYIHHITFADPENVDPHIDCFQTWGPAYNIGFHRNRCSVLEYQSRNERGKGFMIEEHYGPVRDLVITNNIIQAFNHVTAIDAENLTIVHNTFVGNPSFPTWALGAVEFFRSPGAIVRNNVFYNVQNEHVAGDEASRAAWTVDHNAVYRADGGAPRGSPAPGDIWNVDLQLRAPARNDFRPRAGSPLIDAGADAGIAKDVTGRPRPQGDGYDIGAYEYSPPAATPTPTATSTPTPSPTHIPYGPQPLDSPPTPTATSTRRPKLSPSPHASDETGAPTQTPTPVPNPAPAPTLRTRPTPGID